jgi:hypothetical protein
MGERAAREGRFAGKSAEIEHRCHGRIKRLGEWSPLIESDARDPIERFGDHAYFEARDRAQREGGTIDGTRVKLEIAKRQGIEIDAAGTSGRT